MALACASQWLRTKLHKYSASSVKGSKLKNLYVLGICLVTALSARAGVNADYEPIPDGTPSFTTNQIRKPAKALPAVKTNLMKRHLGRSLPLARRALQLRIMMAGVWWWKALLGAFLRLGTSAKTLLLKAREGVDTVSLASRFRKCKCYRLAG
ncbi:MAG: hypothetical protein ACI9ND_002353 [Yoonia sp.]|jgi:hypothetical protein